MNRCAKFLLASLLGISTLGEAAVEIWTSSENVAKALRTQADLFERDFKQHVVITVLNKDLTGQFKTAAIAGRGPDILTWAHDVVGELAASGFIEPILLPPSEKEAFLPVALSAFTYQGQLFGYPYDVESVALITNKALLPEVPKSLEQLRDISIARAKSSPGSHTFLYDINNFFFSFPIISAQGGYIFGAKQGTLDPEDIGLANTGAVDGAQFILSLVKSGVIPSSTDRGIAFEKMKAGQLAATIDGPWALQDLRANKIDFAVSVIPTLGGQTPRPFVGAHGFMIRRQSPNAELCKELIERYFVSAEGIAALYKQDPRGPARTDVLQKIDDPYLAAFMASAANGIPMPNIPEMGAVWASSGQALQVLTSGTEPPDLAMKGMVAMIKGSLVRQ